MDERGCLGGAGWLHLIPTLTVAENLFLGRAPRRWFGIDWRAMRRKAEELLATFDVRVDVERPLGTMPAAVQQLVAIARAVQTEDQGGRRRQRRAYMQTPSFERVMRRPAAPAGEQAGRASGRAQPLPLSSCEWLHRGAVGCITARGVAMGLTSFVTTAPPG